jgi:hypothetical protein
MLGHAVADNFTIIYTCLFYHCTHHHLSTVVLVLAVLGCGSDVLSMQQVLSGLLSILSVRKSR